MTRNQSDRKEYLAIYASLKKGDITWEDWCAYLAESQEFYLKYLIEKKGYGAWAEYDDLMQAGRLAILENAEKYDPAKAAPVTYFTPFIIDHMRELTRQAGMTVHYERIVSKLDRVARECGFEGCMDPGVTAEMLAVLANLPLTTVKEAISRKKISVVSYDDCETTHKLRTAHKSLEERMIREEMNRFLHAQIDECTELEKYLIDNIIFSSRSWRPVVSELRKKEMQERFRDELPRPARVTQVFLEKKLDNTLKDLRSRPDVRMFFAIKTDKR